jgi:hypothetical protein
MPKNICMANFYIIAATLLPHISDDMLPQFSEKLIFEKREITLYDF